MVLWTEAFCPLWCSVWITVSRNSCSTKTQLHKNLPGNAGWWSVLWWLTLTRTRRPISAPWWPQWRYICSRLASFTFSKSLSSQINWFCSKSIHYLILPLLWRFNIAPHGKCTWWPCWRINSFLDTSAFSHGWPALATTNSEDPSKCL